LSKAAGRALGYVRVSTEEQAKHGISLEAQVDRIRAYCLMAGLDLVDVISEEGVSASRALATRPGGARLIAALPGKKVGHVIALKLDRLFRDAADALTQTKVWDTAGVALHLIDMGGATVNTASAMGRFFLSMLAGFAELERNLIAERTSTALQYKKSKRQVYGPTPYGYVREGDTLTAAADEQAAVSRIHLLRAEGKSLRSIAEALNVAGILPKRGGRRWYASTVVSVLGNSIHGAAV
jgi:site-specific DNA recombinase